MGLLSMLSSTVVMKNPSRQLSPPCRINSIEQINLSTNNLFGVIPTELALMSNLRKCIPMIPLKSCLNLPDDVVIDLFCLSSGRIELADNNLFSTIPAELGFLTQVEYLDIGSNQLTGTIPESLGSMENLGESVVQDCLGRREE